MEIREYLAARQKLVDRALDRWTPPETAPPETIHRAMRYSLFAGGKRVRPLLAIAASEAVVGERAGVEDVAATLEMVHTYSLIHDDLPALDDDDLRRGRPTCHKVFGEAMAILAGDALLTLAFQVLAQIPGIAGEVRSRLIGELATAAGTVGGMIGGQVNDLEGEGRTPDAGLLESIHRAKTGALIRASVRMGAVWAGAGGEQLAAISCFGEHIGLAFQIVDDLLDVEQTSEQLGKTAGKDAAQGKITFPSVYGVGRSREMAERELAHAHRSIAPFGERGAALAALADLIVRRSS
jgi:geranylgeranyl diphosphate synthase type II